MKRNKSTKDEAFLAVSVNFKVGLAKPPPDDPVYLSFPCGVHVEFRERWRGWWKENTHVPIGLAGLLRATRRLTSL